MNTKKLQMTRIVIGILYIYIDQASIKSFAIITQLQSCKRNVEDDSL